jgi:hypothetical protein
MRNHRFVILVSVIAMSAWVTVAGANPFTTGTLEISPSVSFNRSSITSPGGNTLESRTYVNFDATFGRCMSDRFELAASLLAQRRPSAGDGRNGFGASVGGILNFEPQANLIPFVSAQIGILSYETSGDRESAMLVPMVRAGFRTMIDETRSLNVSFGYQHQTRSDSIFEESSDSFDVGIGMSWLRPIAQ